MEPEIVGNRVKKLMEKNNLSTQELAKKMEIEPKVLENKLNGKEEFYLGEMTKIKNIFNLDVKECDELFFKEKTEEEKG